MNPRRLHNATKTSIEGAPSFSHNMITYPRFSKKVQSMIGFYGPDGCYVIDKPKRGESWTI